MWVTVFVCGGTVGLSACVRRRAGAQEACVRRRVGVQGGELAHYVVKNTRFNLDCSHIRRRYDANAARGSRMRELSRHFRR